MAWQTAASLNAVISLCYVAISLLVLSGLVRTRQLTSNPLALATAGIFLTCALHHGHHASHLVWGVGGQSAADLGIVRAAFGDLHTAAIDGLGAAVAALYLGLRRNYTALLNTPAMFHDAVRVAAEEQLRRLAFTDVLTGVANRAAFQVRAEALADCVDEVVVAYVDLDGFKALNDTYGHDVGDRVLRDIAQRLRDDLAGDGSVFRIGGDEFVVVAVDPTHSVAASLRSRIEASIGRPVRVRDAEVVVGASVGISAGGLADTVDARLRDADASMYAAKGERRRRPRPVPRSPWLQAETPPGL